MQNTHGNLGINVGPEFTIAWVKLAAKQSSSAKQHQARATRGFISFVVHNFDNRKQIGANRGEPYNVRETKINTVGLKEILHSRIPEIGVPLNHPF